MAFTSFSLLETNPADDNYQPTAADCSTDPDSCPDKMAASFHIPYDSALANRHDLRHYAVVATCLNSVAVSVISGSQSGVAAFTQRSKTVVTPSSG
jgi:hypothetical protein